jgi:hypothetical protein
MTFWLLFDVNGVQTRGLLVPGGSTGLQDN